MLPRADTLAAPDGDVITRPAERHIVAVPVVAEDDDGVDGLEGAVDSGVGHDTHHQTGGVIHVIDILRVLGPERELQRVERQEVCVDGRQDSRLDRSVVVAPIPTQRPVSRMAAAGGIHHTGVHIHMPAPTGKVGGLGIARVAVEILGVGQRVEQAAEGAERVHRRPVGVGISAVGTDIDIVDCIRQQAIQQQAVCVDAGDDMGGIDGEARRAVGHLIVDARSIHPMHHSGNVGDLVDSDCHDGLARSDAVKLDIIDIEISHTGIGRPDGYLSRDAGMAVETNYDRSPALRYGDGVDGDEGGGVEGIGDDAHIEVQRGVDGAVLGPEGEFETVGRHIERGQNQRAAIEFYTIGAAVAVTPG